MSKIDLGYWMNISFDSNGNQFKELNRKDINELIQIVRDECEPKWISVDEMLPANGDYVLCRMEGGATFSAFNVHCCEYTEKYGFDRSRVTHWMPLPEAPKL